MTRSIAHRGDLEQGLNGDLWSILFQLIDERSGVTDVIKVKSHLEDEGPSVITQNKIGFHHMLANSLSDVVAEEAATRLLHDLKLECKAKKTERVGIGVAKRLALVQADIWAKRGAAGDIYELEPLAVAEETSTRSAIEKVVDELVQQGHLLIRHNRGRKCKACNLYRANRQFIFLNRTPCVPRPRAAEVISQFKHKKRQHNESFETVPYPCTSSVNQDIPSKHSHMERLSQPVSSETEGDLAHTQQSITCASPSQVGEHCVRSRYVSAQSHFRGMDGKSRKFDPGKGVVNTPLCVTEPRVPWRYDPEEWELPVLMAKVHAGTKYIARNLLLVAHSSSVERWGALGLVLSLR